MKKVLFAVLLLVASSASAGVNTFRSFSGFPEINTTRITDSSIFPTARVMRFIPGGAGRMTQEMIFDVDASIASVSQTYIAFYSSDVTPSGNVCFDVCYAVIPPESLRSAAYLPHSPTACKTSAPVAITTQYQEKTAAIAGILPYKPDTTACTSAADCRGYEMIMSVKYVACASGSSSNNVDVQSITKYQP